MVAGEAQDVADAQGGSAQHLSLQPHAGAVAGSDLQHRFDAVLQGDERAGEGGHARGGGGVISEVDRVNVFLEHQDLLDHFLRGRR